MDSPAAASPTVSPSLERVWRSTDRTMAWILAAHGVLAIGIGMRTGHVLVAVLGSIVLAGGPALLAAAHPGRLVTRLAMGAALLGFSGLLIQLGNGLLELHFHVFVALALLVIYRDWRVPVAGAVTIALHHVAFHALQVNGVGVHVLPAGHGDAMAGMAGMHGGAVGSLQGWSYIALHAVFVVVETGVVAWQSAVLAGVARQHDVDRSDLDQVRALADGLAEGRLDVEVVASDSELGAAVRAVADGLAELGAVTVSIQQVSGQLAGTARALDGTVSEVRGQVAGIAGATGSLAAGADAQSRDAADAVATGSAMVTAATEAGDLVSASRERIASALAGADAGLAAAASIAEATGEADRSITSVAEVMGAMVDSSSQALHAMQSLDASTRETGAAVATLRQHSDAIGGIVATIAGIAEQTNLLALNAAIEAARAGQEGRGFAVVADEVRKLAEESRHATDSIGALIGEIQASTEAAATRLDEGLLHGASALEHVRTGAERIEEVRTSVDASHQRIAASGEVVDRANAEFERVASDVLQVRDHVERVADHVHAVETGANGVQVASTAIAVAADAASASIAGVTEHAGEAGRSMDAVAEHARQLDAAAHALTDLVARVAAGTSVATVDADVVPLRLVA